LHDDQILAADFDRRRTGVLRLVLLLALRGFATTPDRAARQRHRQHRHQHELLHLSASHPHGRPPVVVDAPVTPVVVTPVAPVCWPVTPGCCWVCAGCCCGVCTGCCACVGVAAPVVVKGRSGSSASLTRATCRSRAACARLASACCSSSRESDSSSC